MLNKSLNSYIFFCLLFFSSINILSAQEFSVNISPGLMNYGGDLQSKGFTVNQAQFAISAGAMYRIKKFALRGELTYGKVKGSDAENTLYPARNLSFESSISEINFTLHYHIFSLDDKKFTPYVFAGAGLFHFNPYTYYNNEKIFLQPLSTEGQGLSAYPNKKMYSLTQPEVPFGLGFKYKMSDRIQLGVEFCSRLLRTDYLDDVSKRYADATVLLEERGQLAVDVSFRGDEINPEAPFPSNERRGNPKSNDNFYTAEFSFIYVFGGGGQSFSGITKHHKKMHALDCPTVQ